MNNFIPVTLEIQEKYLTNENNHEGSFYLKKITTHILKGKFSYRHSICKAILDLQKFREYGQR